MAYIFITILSFVFGYKVCAIWHVIKISVLKKDFVSAGIDNDTIKQLEKTIEKQKNTMQCLQTELNYMKYERDGDVEEVI